MNINSLIVVFLLTLGVSACAASQANDTEIEEGNCKPEYPAWPNVDYLEVAFSTPEEGWMVPMSSKHLAYHVGLQMTGNNSLSQEDMQRMCLRVSLKGLFKYGNDNVIFFSCNSTDLETVNCYFTEDKPHQHVVGPLQLTLVWSDEGYENILIVLCASEAKQSYWLLVSKDVVVDSKVNTKVLSVVLDLGFDTKKVLYHDQSKCTKG